MKKYLSRLLIIMMVFAIMSSSWCFAEVEEPELEVTNITKPTSQVNENDIFLLGFTLRNNTDEAMEEVTVKISGDFYTVNSSTEKELGTISAGDKSYEVEPFQLRYNGGENKTVVVMIKYKLDGMDKMKAVHVPIDAAPSEDGTNVPNNTKVYEPQVVMVGDEQPVIKGDTVSEVEVRIKNDSEYKAENVKITGEFSTSKFQLAEISAVKQIKEMSAKEEQIISFKIKGSEEQKSGVYPVNLKCVYSNVYGDQFEEDFEIYIKYIEDETETDVDVIDTNESQNIVSGDEFDLDLKIKNNSEEAISDVYLQLIELDGDKIINKNSNYKKVDKIQGESSEDISIKMITNENLPTGNYTIKLEISFKDINGKETKRTKIIQKKVELTESELFIGGISSSHQILDENQSFEIKVPVINYGSRSGEKIKVQVEANGDIMSTASNVVLIDEILPGEQKEVLFNLKASPKAKDGSKEIKVKLTDGKDVQESSINVYVESTEESSDSEPKLIVSEYSPIPVEDSDKASMVVKAGKEFDLNLSLMNSHFEKTVRNIKVTLTTKDLGEESSGNIFTPVNSSNTFFIDEINPKESSDMTVRLYTIPDAQSKTYSIDVNMEYEDENGNKYTATDLIGVPVRQQSKFMTSDINVPEKTVLGEPVRMDVTISNTGKTDLMNFTVKVEGDFTSSNSNTYIGKIQPGEQQYYDVDLYPTLEGINNGKFIFSYEEPDGSLVEEIVEFKSNASKAVKKSMAFDMDNMPNKNGNGMIDQRSGFPVKIVAIVGVGVLGIIMLLVFVKRRGKKEKDIDFDE